ncbi:MAG: ABC transporter permease [Actinobacteria bacterium]|nr:ABC transporter permease [Actinomycetota bacterium]
MTEGRLARVVIQAGAALAMAFLYVPLLLVVLYAFSKSIGFSWPPSLFTTKWFAVAFRDPDLMTALLNSLKAAVVATAVALVLGTLAATAVHRYRFFGRESVSFVLVLPISLPGIVTALALSSAVDQAHAAGLPLSFGIVAIVLGHATFCVVVVYNNVLARMRRTPGSLVEASLDLGADPLQTLYLAGTTQTLPLWIFNHIRLPVDRPIVNVVAMLVLIASIVPVWIAQRLAGGAEGEGVTAIGTPRGGAAP